MTAGMIAMSGGATLSLRTADEMLRTSEEAAAKALLGASQKLNLRRAEIFKGGKR